MTIKLSKRLETIANFVPSGHSVADIGTDHALIPSYLVKNNISPCVIAGDIHKGPLESAQKQINNLFLDNKINLRLGDGLEILKPGEVDIVIIAGMGGVTIREILVHNPEVVASLKRLILQPNMAVEQVRRWALDNNWNIIDEELLYEDGQYYEIIILEKGKMIIENDILLLLGPKLVLNKHKLLIPYYRKIYKKEQDIIQALEKTSSKNALQKAVEMQEKWKKIKQVIKCL